ncbi:unnamed protein product [Arctogadus glacialis]
MWLLCKKKKSILTAFVLKTTCRRKTTSSLRPQNDCDTDALPRSKQHIGKHSQRQQAPAGRKPFHLSGVCTQSESSGLTSPATTTTTTTTSTTTSTITSISSTTPVAAEGETALPVVMTTATAPGGHWMTSSGDVSACVVFKSTYRMHVDALSALEGNA